MPRIRSERDSWDITTSVGSTALFVAAARALEARKPDPLAIDRYAAMFCRAAGGDWADVVDGRAEGHQLTTASFGEHFVNYQGARTRYFDDYFRRASDAGARQVVILAAGLDSRAYRLPWPEAPEPTVIFELDQPRVLDFKRAVLAEHNARPMTERREVPIDLRQDWPGALRDSGFDADRPSAWIAEGLLIYLPGAAQEQLFDGVQSLTAPGSHIAVEDVAPMPAGELAAAIVEEKAANDAGEPRLFYQLIYNERCAPVNEWFGAHGWTARVTRLTDYLREHNRPIPALSTEVGSIVANDSLARAVRGGDSPGY